jgi:hypothetical protein
MPKPHHDLPAADARKALEAYKADASEDLETSIAELITDIGHLCMVEQIDFLATVCSGVRHWAAERINPKGRQPGPTVEVTISVQGLSPRAKPKARDPAKPKTSRTRR